MEEVLLIYNQIIYPKLVTILLVMLSVSVLIWSYLGLKLRWFLEKHYPDKFPRDWRYWPRYYELRRKYPDWHPSKIPGLPLYSKLYSKRVKELKKDPKLKYVYMLPEELRDDPEAVKKYEQAHKWNIIWVIVAIITFYVWLTYPMQFLLKRFYH
jgi:hypothetical protein